MKLSIRVRVVLGIAATVALVFGVLMWANPAGYSGLDAVPDHYSHEVATGPARGGLFLAAAFLAVGAASSNLKYAGWWLSVVATTLGVGLMSSLIYGLGMSNLVDDLIGGNEVRRYLLTWPPVLVVATLAGGLVGTRSIRQALLTSVGALLAGGLVGAVGLPFGLADGLPTQLLLGIGLGYFLVRTWIRRPQSLRAEVS